MELLAMYDIADPVRLRKIERTMRRFGVRVQKSVFECSLSEAGVERMKRDVSKLMVDEEDSFRIYPLLADSRLKQMILGRGEVPVFQPAFVA